MIFKDANIHTNIIIAERNTQAKEILFYDYKQNNTINDCIDDKHYNISSTIRDVLKEDWIFTDDEKSQIIQKLNQGSIPLGDISSIAKGSETGKNEIFTFSNEIIKTNNIENELIRKCIKNSHIKRYSIEYQNIYLLYTDNNFNPQKYPNAYGYLKNFKKELLDRRGPLHNEYEWYRLHRPSIKEVFDAKEKIIVPYRAESNKFAYDNEQHFNDGGDIRALIIKNEVLYNIKFILAILNSHLMDWFYGFIGKPKGKMREYFNEPIALIPIRTIDFSNPDDKQKHDTLVSLVDQMLTAQKDCRAAKSDNDKKLHEQKISMLDKKIDDLVYKLYGLTDEEIGIVEG